MTAVLTGDIVNSREDTAWLDMLKAQLTVYGPSPKTWEIYRGDSFQLEIVPQKSLLTAIHLKAIIKQINALDIRIAIGLGKKSLDMEKITESNGTAFVHSGTCFDKLKKTNLAIKSSNAYFDGEINLLIELALLTMDNWAPITAQVVKERLENPDLNQTELGALTGRSQSNISAALNRAGFNTLLKMDQAFRNKLDNYDF